MSKADDILKKYGITQVKGSGGSASSSTSNTSTQNARSTGSTKADGILAKYGVTQVRVDEKSSTGSAQNWIDSSKSYLSDAEKYLSSWRKRNDKDEEYASLMKRNSSLIAEAYNWRNQYAGDDEAVSYINEVISALSNSRGSFKKYLDYYDQWETEDDYKKALQYSTPEGRQDQYDQNKKRLEELKLQRNSLHYQPGMNPYANNIGPNTMPIYGSGYGAAKEDLKSKATELEKEIAALEKEIRFYEHGETDEDGFYYGFKTADDYGKRLQDSKFVSASKNRTYHNADRAELDAYDVSQSEGSTAISNGGYFDDEGNIRNAKGEIVQYASAPEVQDKLGLFLSASQKDIEEAYNILSASNGNYETTWADIMQEGDTKRWKYLKDDELQIYYGLLRLEGQEAAYRYLDAMEVELGRREMKETYTAIEESSGLEQIMLNAASVPMNMLGGIAATVDNASRLLQGKELNPYSRAQSLSSAGNYIRYNTAQEIDEATGGLAIPGLDFSFGDAYQAGMSMVDSLVGAKIGGTAYQAVMSMGAASTEAARLYSQGASTEQIVLGSVAAGAAEWVFEKYSIENLINLKAPESKLKWVKNALIQGGIEMSEEAATELANIITNGLIMQSESDWAKLLEENGGDYGKAIKAMAIQIANAGLGGFLSGLGSGAIQQGMQYGAQQKANAEMGQYISGANSTDALMALAQEMAANATKGDQKRLTAQSERLGKNFLTERGKNRAIGRLYNTVQSVVNEQNISEISSALQEKGISKKDAAAIADAVAAQTNGVELSDDQQKVLDKFGSDEKVQAVLDNILDNADSGINQRAKSIAKFEFGAMRNHIISQAEKALAEQEKSSASDKVDSQKESVSESRYEASVDGETILKSTGETVSIREIAAIKDGKMTLRLADGSTVDASEVSYASADEALVYETVAKMGASANAANILVNGLKTANDSGLTASEYAHGIEEAFRYGKLNDKIGLANSVFASKLNPGQQEYVYRQGQRVAGKQVAKEQATVNKSVQAAKATESADNNKSYRAILEDGISALSLNESQKASYKLADQIAEAAKVNIRVYVGKTGEHGYYNPKTDEIYLNLNATNKSRKSMMAFTLGHELVHRAKKGSPAKYEAFANFLVEQYGKQGSSVDAMIAEELAAAKEFGIEMSYDKAFEEVVCNACQRMLLDTDAGQKLAAFGAQNKQNKSFLDDVKRWITEFMDKLRSIFAGVDPDSMAAKEFAKFDESVKQILADMYVDMTIDAGENLSVIQNAFGKDTQVHANENGEFTMANSEDGSKKVFNLVTWNNGGRETLEATLLREGYTEDEVNAALTIMDEKQRLVESIANEVDGNGKMAFPEQGRINEATLTTDLKDGHSVLSALVSNGDYPVNIDLLMVCKKRKAYQRVINRLCETGLIQQATVDALAIAEINKILGKYGFETACLGCFVESRRLRIQEWAQTIVKEWNSEVKKRNPNAKAFGFGKGEATLTPDEVMKIIGELESGGEKNDKGNLNLGQGSAVKRMGVLLDKVPSLQRTLSIEDLITPDGLTSLRSFDSNLFSMVKSRYGSNSPKFVQEFNPYNHELAKYGKVPTQYKSLREYLYAIGGARMQSFSDFIIENWFDYCQIVADLAARKLPMHTYTKEIALAKLFGLTGIKINMSLIPDVDRSLGKEFAGLTRNSKGELELIWADKDRFKATGGKSYMQSINFADAIALQNDPRYSANVGTIAVGISDKHIEVMLDDARIRMIIPYHSSGMNPIFADLMGTSYYKDYTNFQNTTIKQIYNSKGQKVDLKLDKTETGKLTSGFQFNEVLQDLGDARAAAEAYKEWCADASKHTITIKGETYTAELTPKFNDFSGHQNYYKLLEDFNTYDCISEEAARQGDVQQIYPEDFDKILKDELKVQEKHRQKQEANQAFDKAMGEIESYLKNHSKADTVYYANQHGIKLGAKDKKLNAEEKEKLKKLQAEGASFSLPRVDSDGNQLSKEQQEYFKHSVVRDSDGNLLVMYHGTADGGAFTVFDGDKLGNSTRTSQIGQGFYFTNMKKEAEAYMKNMDAYGRASKGRNPNLHQVYLNITNPFDINADKLDIEKVKAVYMDGTYDYFFDDWIPFYLNKKTVDGEVLTKAALQGMSKEQKVSLYVDYYAQIGIRSLLSEMVRAFPSGKQSELLTAMKKHLGYDGIVDEFAPGQYQYVAFSPEQIKNVNNQNPTSDPDIRYSLPRASSESYKEPAYQEWDVQAALYDALDHADKGDDNMILVGEMPRYVTEKIGIGGDFYIYRNHAYENMVTKEQAIKDGRPVIRKGETVHFHDLGVDRMTEAIMSLENPTMTIATKTKEGNPAIIMLLPVKGKNKAPLYAVLSFYSNRPINGDLSRKPHVVLTIAEREFFGSKGRSGYADIVGRAVQDGRVIDFNKKMRDALSVIANPAGVGNITDSSLSDNLARFRKEIKSFREKNHIDYKLPVGEDTSPRALLANAFDTVITNPIEKNKLQEYKKNVAMLNEEEAKLRELREQIRELSFAKGPKDTKKIRSLQFEANQAANRINTLDKMLLRFEASAPLQNVLNREKELAYKRADKKRKDDLAAYRERAAKTQRELLDRWQESRKRGIEGRQKTAMRHKIKDVVNELNQYLLKGTKDRHVPIGLQKAVAEALNAVNMDTVGAEERIAKLQADLMKAKTPDEIQEISKKIDNIREMGDRLDEKLKRLKTAYDEFINSDDPLIANSHDDAVSAHMMKLIVRVGDTPLREMTLDQLQDVYDVYKVVLATIRNANKSFKDNKNREISTRANQVMAEIDDLGVKRGKRPVFMNWVEKFGWDGLKPVYAMEHIGSQGLIDAYNNVRAGEDTWAKDIVEAREYYLEKFRKYKYDSWDFEKKHKFTSTTEMNFELTLDQIMSLYAYSKRDQAADHLKYGGIVFDPKTEVVEKTKSGIKVKYNVANATAYNISEETLADIIGTLTEDQKGFVDEMQTYLSDVMGAKGNEVSLAMYDVKLFREKHYFPLKSAHQYMAKAKEQAQGDVKIKNSGFSKETKPHAKNPIVLSSFMDVWTSHVNEMSMYHAFVLPMEDFYRIYNYTTPSKDENLPTEGVNASIENAYGSGATEYIEQMLKDLNGGARSDSRTGFINKMMGLFKKGAVFASLSVVVQQPSAIARAAALVDTKYFIGPKVDHKRHKALWDEVKRYAPVAIIKEMGYFDTNMGKSTQDFIVGQEYSGFSEKMKALVTDSNYRDEVLSKAPALADEIAWCGIWEAVKRETKDKNPSMDVTSEEFLNKVGNRFTDVIVKTQVYDSVLSRSALMRSKDTGLKMATAFMAEPTTSINMVADALLKGKRGNRKYGRTAIGAVIASQIINSILVSFVYAGRDDDEDETYAEKYIGTLSGEILDSLNPAGYIPFIKDIMSIVQGYDVERSDMAVVNDLWKAWQNLSKDDVSVYRKVEGFAGSIAQIFGLPVKNIMRDARGIYQTVMSFMDDQKTTKAGIKYAIQGAITGKTATNKEQLYDARMAGDEEHATRVEARYGDTDSADAAVRAAIKDSFMADEIDEVTALKQMVLYAGMDASEAHWTMDAWKYRKTVGSDDGYSKYGKFYDAVRTGKDLKATVKAYTDNGVKPSTLAGQITEEFKPEYVKMSASQRASMKGYLVNAFTLCGVERDSAMEKLASWDWEAEGFEDATSAAIRNYNEYCGPAGISKSVFMAFWKFDNSTENDVDENGKKIAYSAVKKIMAYIDSLNLTNAQKDALAKSAGWEDSTIKKYKTW